MAEALSHMLAAFVIFTLLSWRIEWLERKWVVVAMVGSILPDLNRFGLILDSDTIEAVLGIPFSWGAIHTLGGVLLLSAIGALIFAERRNQLIGFVMLLGGGVSHFLIDAVKAWGDGYNGVYLYPFSWWRNPTPGWYVSADRWVVVITLILALMVFLIDVSTKNPEWIQRVRNFLWHD